MFRGPDGSQADRGDKEETDDFYSLPRAQEAVNVPFAKWHWVAPASQKAFFFFSLINCRQPFCSVYLLFFGRCDWEIWES